MLLRQKGYTLLNITGLTLGIAVFTFIFLYIQSEIRYDRQWSDYSNIYRVTSEYKVDASTEKIALTPFRLASDFKIKFPQVIRSTNMFFTDPSDINDVSSVIYNDIVYEIPDITLSGPEFFKIFDYQFIEGDSDSALSKPNSMVISKEIANKIFGNEKVIGKKLKTVIREYTISGVFEKRCNPTHQNFDAIVSVSSLEESSMKRLADDWYWLTCYTYIQVHDTTDINRLEEEFNKFATVERSRVLEDEDITIDGYFVNNLEAINDVHFNTELQYDSPSNIDINYLYIFGIIAAFILITASINYINLATARVLKRVRDIGIRKVMGATRKQLVQQFVSESFIITIISFIIALVLVELLMPQFNALIGKELILVNSIFKGTGLIFGLILLAVIILFAIIGGSFPAFIISSYSPASVIKNNDFILKSKKRRGITADTLRKTLVTVQYIVSVGLIISTLIIWSQLDFLEYHDLGFDKSNIFVINTPDDTTFRKRTPDFLNDLQEHNSIVNVSSAMNVPGYTMSKMMFYIGDTSKQNIQSMNYYNVGYNYFELLKAPLVKGSLYKQGMYKEDYNYYIVNEAAHDLLDNDGKNILGMKLGIWFNEDYLDGEIIGVVRNFNFSSLHSNVEPLVFLLTPNHSRYVLVKHKHDQAEAALNHIRITWEKYNKGNYMHFSTLENKLSSLYKGDKNMLSLFIYFALFVIFISSLGLYGLTSFLIQQRTREIGIRRVLGGSEIQILTLLAVVYLRIVLIAGIIASVIVYFLMNHWLNTFAFHIKLNGWFFLFGILITLSIAFITVTIRSFKVVREKPSKALKYLG
jgi:putative ABC transport system permease protein